MQSNKEMIDYLESTQHNVPRKVFDAMRSVDRGLFLLEGWKDYAYDHTSPLPIGEDSTCSAPEVVSEMCAYLDLKSGQKVLEIGAGCGYHASIVAEIVYPGRVISLEIKQRIAELARKNIARAKNEFKRDWNIEVIDIDGSGGYKEEAPYDRIYFTAGISEGFPTKMLFDQLVNGGRFLLAPSTGYYKLGLKKEDGSVTERYLTEGMRVGFVDLLGKYG